MYASSTLDRRRVKLTFDRTALLIFASKHVIDYVFHLWPQTDKSVMSGEEINKQHRLSEKLGIIIGNDSSGRV